MQFYGGGDKNPPGKKTYYIKKVTAQNIYIKFDTLPPRKQPRKTCYIVNMADNIPFQVVHFK